MQSAKGRWAAFWAAWKPKTYKAKYRRSLMYCLTKFFLKPTSGAAILPPWHPKKWKPYIASPTVTPKAKTCCCSIPLTAHRISTSTSPSAPFFRRCTPRTIDRKSVVSGKSVSDRVDLGGRRIIKKQQRNKRHD